MLSSQYLFDYTSPDTFSTKRTCETEKRRLSTIYEAFTPIAELKGNQLSLSPTNRNAPRRRLPPRTNGFSTRWRQLHLGSTVTRVNRRPQAIKTAVLRTRRTRRLHNFDTILLDGDDDEWRQYPYCHHTSANYPNTISS